MHTFPSDRDASACQPTELAAGAAHLRLMVAGLSVPRGLLPIATIATWPALSCGGTPASTEPLTPAAFVVVAGDHQLHFPGVTTFAPMTAGLVDASGQRVRVSGLRVSWSVLQGDGSIEPTRDTTSGQGLAGAQWTLGAEEGINRVRVSADGVAPAEFTARAAKPGPIVFVRGGAGGTFDGFPGDLFVMKEDGSDVMVLFPPGYPQQFLSGPAWSPDGSKILFVRAMGRQIGGIQGLLPLGMFRITSDARREQQVPANGLPDYVQFLEEPTWSPSGNRIIARLGGEGEPGIPSEVTPGQLHVMRSAGTGIQPLGSSTSAAHSPSWSPTADRIAFSCGFGEAADICVVDDDGDNLRRLTGGAAPDLNPAWSPDGERLLFARDPDNAGGIWLINEDGSDLRQVISGIATAPSWAPDGSRFVVTIEDAGQLDIYLVDLATGQRTNLTNSPSRDREASWRW